MKLKKSLLGFGLMMAVVASGAQAQDRVIRFGSDATYPPFESTNPSGEIVGFDIDLAKAMCTKLQAKCTFVNQGWDGIIPALQAKKFDVIASSMSITPERSRAINFTQKIWTVPNTLLGKTDAGLDTTKDALKGKTVGVQQGTIQDKYATKYFTETNIKRYKTAEDAYNDLKTGRLDGVFSDGGITRDFLKTPAGKGFAIQGQELTEAADPEIFGKGTGFGVRKSDKALLADLNKAYDEIRADGTFKKIADKYFDYDIYGAEVKK